ncbi:MAG: cytochrome C oxidase subunit II [Deltaproteobacteria bacterium]|nr:cytochrome C oxidase subunit II [Deltaproteobacteria bacterium]
MVESSTVLYGQTIIYTCYALAIIALMGWFGWRVSRPGTATPTKPAIFYGFVGLLVVAGVSLHIITYNTIPWAPLDLNRRDIPADRAFAITVARHEFRLPAPKLSIRCHEKVLFDVTSADLTYGFGLFRPDQSMLFQMQVVPGHRNDILWQFDHPGVYSIRSTEYSGPAGAFMLVKDAVEVTGCDRPTS